MKPFLFGAATAATATIAVAPTAAMASGSAFVEHPVVSVDLSSSTSELEFDSEYTLHALLQRLDATLISGKQAAALCDNPHDSRKCAVDLGLTCSRDTGSRQGVDKSEGDETNYTVATSFKVPAFFQEAAREGELKDGDHYPYPAFRARFRARTALGRCTATVFLNGKRLLVSARNNTGNSSHAGTTPVRDDAIVVNIVEADEASRQKEATTSPGFIGVDNTHRQYFVDSSAGNLFFPIGPNLAWPGGVNSTKPFYSSTLPALQTVGGNYARIWLGPSQVCMYVCTCMCV